MQHNQGKSQTSQDWKILCKYLKKQLGKLAFVSKCNYGDSIWGL
jgi:hypothetical protein